MFEAVKSNGKTLICCECKKRCTKENKEIFELFFLSKYNLRIKIFKPSHICTQCAIKKWENNFETYKMKTFIGFTDKKISINWKKYWETIFKIPERQVEINQMLFEIGIFSYRDYILYDKKNKPLLKGPPKIFFSVKKAIEAIDCVRGLTNFRESRIQKLSGL